MATTAKKKSAPKQGGKTAPKNEVGEQKNDPMLEELFTDSLKDIYWAEKHLTKALPKLAKATSSEELKNAFNEHLEVTKTHISRLEQVFALIGEKAQAKKCEAMEGLSKEADSIIEDTEAGTATRDVGLIMAGQKVEHYEIATYGSLAALAKVLGMDEASELLESTLEEEKEADEKLTSIAENDINYAAANDDEES